MYSDILFTSSYSSQIGVTIALIKKYNLLFNEIPNRSILIINLGTKSDIKCKYSFFEDYEPIVKKYFNHFSIIRINNIFKRIILYLTLALIRKKLINKEINIWEPRPGWIDSLFTSKLIKLPKLLYNRKTNYFGEGFSCLSKAIPFWLSKEGKKIDYKISNSSNFFFHYELEHYSKSLNKSKKYINIEPELIIGLFNEMLNSDKEEIKDLDPKLEIYTKSLNNLIIFPFTTFSETKRTSLNSEINLYIDYFEKNIKNKNDPILLKSHPGSTSKKFDLLSFRLADKGYNLINSKDIQNEIFLNLPLEIIPLEFLCLKIHHYLHLPYSKIFIPLISNATLSTLRLYPNINYLRPFGEKLISKHIGKNFINKRLDQEKIMLRKIKDLYV